MLLLTNDILIVKQKGLKSIFKFFIIFNSVTFFVLSFFDLVYDNFQVFFILFFSSFLGQ